MLSPVLLFCISYKLGSLTDIFYRRSQIEKHVVVSTFSTATGGRECGEEEICHKKVQQSFLNQSLDSTPPPPPKSNIRELAPDYYKLRSSQLFYFKVRQSLLKFATTGITKYDDYYKLGQYTLVTLFKVCKSHTYFQKGGRKKCARDNHER